jgi:hypothetical protein
VLKPPAACVRSCGDGGSAIERGQATHGHRTQSVQTSYAASILGVERYSAEAAVLVVWGIGGTNGADNGGSGREVAASRIDAFSPAAAACAARPSR